MIAAKQLHIQHSASRCQQKDKLVLWDTDVSTTAQGRLKMNHIPNSSIPTYIYIYIYKNNKMKSKSNRPWRGDPGDASCAATVAGSSYTVGTGLPWNPPAPETILALCPHHGYLGVVFCICAERSYTFDFGSLTVTLWLQCRSNSKRCI